MYFLDNIWLIPLFPAIGAACMFFFGRKLQKSAVSGICVGMVVLAFAWACLAVWQYNGYAVANAGKPFEKIMFTWLAELPAYQADFNRTRALIGDAEDLPGWLNRVKTLSTVLG